LRKAISIDGYELVHGLVVESNGALLGLTHYLFHRSTIAIEPVSTCRIYSRRKLRAAKASAAR
jgi:hypothetical protein